MRIRSIKPEFWASEDIAALDVPTRLTFIGLWNYVDDSGVGRDSERVIAAALYPWDDAHEGQSRMFHALRTLAEHGLITRYVVGDRSYLAINAWHHQKINRPTASRFPRPDDPAARTRGGPADLSLVPH